MRTTRSFLWFLSAFLPLLAAPPPSREELKAQTTQLQQTPNDTVLRENLIKLAQTLKPPPTIPEDAREPFVMGATVLKRAGGPADAARAVELFTKAIQVAPWFADAYYNRAIARETAGQFEPAMDDLRLYLLFKLTDQERREVQDRIYALKADAQLAATKKAEQDKVSSAEAAKRQTEQVKRDALEKIKRIINNRRYNCAILSASETDPWAGVNKNELSGNGKYWMFGNYNNYIYYWKFFDDRIEIWVTSNNGHESWLVRGEPHGPQISDIEWFNRNGRTWGFFDSRTGNLYVSSLNSPRPFNDSEFNPSKRYCYERFGPPN